MTTPMAAERTPRSSVSPSVCAMLGLAGLSVTVSSWVTTPTPITYELSVIIVICALGGLLPLRLPGLQPLPFSLPIVGCVAVSMGATEAMASGFVAGMATLLSPLAKLPGERFRTTRPDWLASWALGGALAIAAGVVASGAAWIGRLSLPPAPPSVGPVKTIVITGFFALAFSFTWAVTRAAIRGGGGSWREASRAAVASVSAAGAAIGLASAWSLLGEVTILACLVTASAVSLVWGVALTRSRNRILRSERRARMSASVVEAIALAIEAKDRTSERHLRRVRAYALGIGQKLGMTPDELDELEYAAMLHDIGKLVVPESILSKPSALSSEEYEAMTAHPSVGAEILGTTPLPPGVAAAVRHHHERYDGSGYPDGLMGVEIPLPARILAAVDTFDAITSERPHRRGLSTREALMHLEEGAGTLFDPRVVAILVEHHDELENRLLEEERARHGHPVGAPEDRPLQIVLDRIASSHMEIYSLYEIGQSLGKTLDLQESFTLIAGKIHRLIHFSTCVIYILDRQESALRPRFATGVGDERILDLSIPLGARLSGWAAAEGRGASSGPSSAADGRPRESDLEDLAHDEAIGSLRSSLVAPLSADGSLLGVIALYDTADREYTAQEEHLLSLITPQVSAAIRAGMVFEKAEEHALTDSLTGLPNARYMSMAFEQEVARTHRTGHPLTVLTIDVDDFAEINRRFGHPAGDRLLVGLSKVIRSQLRECDLCARQEGDEFVAILPGLDEGEAVAVIDRMKDAVARRSTAGREGPGSRLTISVGRATLGADGEDLGALIARARERSRPVEPDREAEKPAPGVLAMTKLGGPKRP